MKTVLAPNAPWPKWEPVSPKRSHHKKKRPLPSETDAKFEQWLNRQNLPKKEFPNGIR